MKNLVDYVQLSVDKTTYVRFEDFDHELLRQILQSFFDDFIVNRVLRGGVKPAALGLSSYPRSL